MKKEPKQRREEIIGKAAQLFQEEGYRAISMRQLAENLNMKAASLYNHITSKQEILSEIVMEVAERFTRHCEEVVAAEELSATDKMRAIVEMHVEITIEKTYFLACMNTDWIHLDPEMKRRYIDLRNTYEKDFRCILKQGIDRGEFAEIDLDIGVFSLLSTLRTFYLWYAKNENKSEDYLKEEMSKLLLNGIKA